MHKLLHSQLQRAKHASFELGSLSTNQKNAVLLSLAQELHRQEHTILRANQKDLQALPTDYPMRDRLLLNTERLHNMSTSLKAVVQLHDPIGQILDKRKQPSGITITRRRVPLGVVGIIYEARPNVTIEIFSLGFKTGNAIILKGSKDAFETNKILVRCIQASLTKHGISKEAVQLINPLQRELTEQLLQAHGLVDVIIPRGSNRLIQFVRETAKVPVIETGAGVCHTYIEQSANLTKALKIVVNAKTRRPTVCNTLDCLVLDQAILNTFLPSLAKALQPFNVVIHADAPSYKLLQTHYPNTLLKKATPADFGTEYLSLQLAIKTVPHANEGIAFVQAFTSGHSEAIMTNNSKIAQQFTQLIDAAAVYVNTSIAFTDGFEFGLGAEVGISTQKLHARGPMGLNDLTTYKWIVTSQGKIRTS
jgi:glutamate-5-semialdehyde dehydrogenase